MLYALCQSDNLVLVPINSRTVTNYRKAFQPSRAKSEPIDAKLIVPIADDIQLGRRRFINSSTQRVNRIPKRFVPWPTNGAESFGVAGKMAPLMMRRFGCIAAQAITVDCTYTGLQIGGVQGVQGACSLRGGSTRTPRTSHQ